MCIRDRTYTLVGGDCVQISIVDGTWYVTSGSATMAETISGDDVECAFEQFITAAAGTLPNGVEYTATVNTGNVSFNPNGAINWDNSNILTLDFSDSVDVEIIDDVGFWQVFNGATSSITTNADDFDVSDFSFTNVTNSGKVITYAGGSSNGSTGWGSIVAPNTTQLILQGVGVDQLIFKASKSESLCTMIYDLQNKEICDTAPITKVHIDDSANTAGAGNVDYRYLNPSLGVISNTASSVEEIQQWIADNNVDISAVTPTLRTNLGVPDQATINQTDIAQSDFYAYLESQPVSYTHLTLPTICSV